MRLSLSIALAAAPLLFVACSSFSSTLDDSAADGGMEAEALLEAGTGVEARAEAGTAGKAFVEDPIDLSVESGSHAIAAAGDSVVWLIGTDYVATIAHLPTTTVKRTAAFTGRSMTRVGTDGVAVYWAENDATEGVVYRRGFTETAPTTPFSTTATIGVLAVGPTGFLAGTGGSGGTDFYAPNGVKVTTVFHELAGPVVDGKAIDSLFQGNIVYETSLMGGEVELAHNLPGPSSLVLDANNAYAVIQSGTAIVKIPRTSNQVDDSAAPLPRLITTLPSGTTLLTGSPLGELFVWTDGDGSISQIDPISGERTVLKTGITRVESITASRHGLFWATPTAVTWLPR